MFSEKRVVSQAFVVQTDRIARAKINATAARSHHGLPNWDSRGRERSDALMLSLSSITYEIRPCCRTAAL
ncbi:hypothetical protein GCM10011402_05210 [Paracoccus acridae]|uniref:Uncharacterized protein n=1 Tax=Paracoccus acridae TaxID=1795310 RepID=A0ABQ1VE30_9RHOB|nr:hypothetical protein GCM10011402_05210 [Paracoccus acridae]